MKVNYNWKKLEKKPLLKVGSPRPEEVEFSKGSVKTVPKESKAESHLTTNLISSSKISLGRRMSKGPQGQLDWCSLVFGVSAFTWDIQSWEAEGTGLKKQSREWGQGRRGENTQDLYALGASCMSTVLGIKCIPVLPVDEMRAILRTRWEREQY